MAKNNYYLLLFILLISILTLALIILSAWRPSADFQLISTEKTKVNSVIFKKNDGKEIFSTHTQLEIDELSRPFLGFSSFHAKGSVEIEANYSISGKLMNSSCRINFNSSHCFGELYFSEVGIKCTDCSGL